MADVTADFPRPGDAPRPKVVRDDAWWQGPSGMTVGGRRLTKAEAQKQAHWSGVYAKGHAQDKEVARKKAEAAGGRLIEGPNGTYRAQYPEGHPNSDTNNARALAAQGKPPNKGYAASNPEYMKAYNAALKGQSYTPLATGQFSALGEGYTGGKAKQLDQSKWVDVATGRPSRAASPLTGFAGYGNQNQPPPSGGGAQPNQQGGQSMAFPFNPNTMGMQYGMQNPWAQMPGYNSGSPESVYNNVYAQPGFAPPGYSASGRPTNISDMAYQTGPNNEWFDPITMRPKGGNPAPWQPGQPQREGAGSNGGIWHPSYGYLSDGSKNIAIPMMPGENNEPFVPSWRRAGPNGEQPSAGQGYWSANVPGWETNKGFSVNPNYDPNKPQTQETWMATPAMQQPFGQAAFMQGAQNNYNAGTAAGQNMSWMQQPGALTGPGGTSSLAQGKGGAQGQGIGSMPPPGKGGSGGGGKGGAPAPAGVSASQPAAPFKRSGQYVPYGG